MYVVSMAVAYTQALPTVRGSAAREALYAPWQPAKEDRYRAVRTGSHAFLGGLGGRSGPVTAQRHALPWNSRP